MSGLLSILVSALVAATVVLVVIGLWPDILPASPRSGERGQRRKEALEGNRLFRRAEPLLRLLSGAVDPFCPKRLNAKADDLMAKTGFALGLDGKDLVALSLLMAGICGASGGVFLEWLGKGPGAGVTLGAIFGAAFFWLKFQDVAKRRLIIIARGLPGVLDLTSQERCSRSPAASIPKIPSVSSSCTSCKSWRSAGPDARPSRRWPNGCLSCRCANLQTRSSRRRSGARR